MKVAMPAAAALAAVLVTGPAAGQDVTTIVPGAPSLAPDAVESRSDTFTIENYRAGAVWQSSRLVRTVSRVAEGGRVQIRQAQVYDTPQGVTYDTTWIDAATLEPVRYAADVYGDIQKFTFRPDGAAGSVTPKDSAARSVDVSVPVPFFNAVSLELLVQALPMQPGASYAFTVYNPPASGPIAMTLRYVGRETLPLARGGSVAAVKLAVNERTHFWVDAQTGALLIAGGGFGGGNAFWKVRSDVDASALVRASLQMAPLPDDGALPDEVAFPV